MADDIAADVLIIGSGISGALMAARLAAAGVKVAVLEAGARVDRGAAV
jgi:choline dehydrogenase-like flavoprotein